MITSQIFFTDDKYDGTQWGRGEIVLPSKYLFDRRRSLLPNAERKQERWLAEDFFNKRYNDQERFLITFGITEIPENQNYDLVKEIVQKVKSIQNISLLFTNDTDLYDHASWNREKQWLEALSDMPHERVYFILNNTLSVQKFNTILPNTNVEFGSAFLHRFIDKQTTPLKLNFKPRSKHFLCLNSRPTKHRDIIYNKLKDYGTAWMSYRMRNVFLPNEDNPWNNNQKDVFKKDPELANKSVGTFADDPDGNWEKFQDIIPAEFYNDSCIYVCTESVFGTVPRLNPSDPVVNSHWWTEKLIKSFFYRLPVIVVGNPHILESIRSLGFKTFSDFWSESYDYKTDSDRRMQNILDILESLNNMPISKINDMYYSKEMQDILNHNYKNMFSLNDKYVCS
jgi:hypothetical protein